MPRIPQEEMQIAVNLDDLDYVHALIKRMMLKGRISDNPNEIAKVDGNSRAIPFTCKMLTAASLCDIIRDEARKTAAVVRVYVKRQVWSRVPQDTRMTTVEDGKLLLNPEVFRSIPVIPAPTSKPEIQKVDL